MLVSKKQGIAGFTLIEIIIGMVVFAIALTLFTSLIVPQATRSVDPILQVKASELAQSLMNEIASKSFDENASRSGGAARCNEGSACTTSAALGPDGSEDRNSYNDVDDYNGLIEEGSNIKNTLGSDISLDGQPLYQGFKAEVSVFYDDNMDGLDDALTEGSSYAGNTKLIKIAITTPNADTLIFTTFRANY